MTEEIIDRLAQFDAATIHEAQGKTGALPERIRPIDPHMTVVGRAFTVDTRPGDNLAMHLAVEDADPGQVLVINAHNSRRAGAWGDILTAFAQKNGLVGLVIDGAVRDTEQIMKMGFPVFASGVSIRGTSKAYPGDRGQQVTLDGQVVSTGDYILGDRDGVVVVAARDIEAVLQSAQRRVEAEQEYRVAIESGVSTVDLLDLRRDAVVKQGKGHE
ncbi:4-carboxy-4-hydroxy-2-oxoadipate aldolase/oxaloacetate decarboxylase [Micrococcus terreus]|uniref:4-carboxy-4-hydroxy-2-oxoadipate aldolase/oxaloacetate decarboxylase n=1 Tax=Micrococcus terreus TaxID=574650 RepID=UPI0030195D37